MVNKNAATAVTGIAVAMAAGTAAYMVTHRQTSGGKKLRRNAAKAIKTLGSVLDSVESIIH